MMTWLAVSLVTWCPGVASSEENGDDGRPPVWDCRAIYIGVQTGQQFPCST